MPKLPEIIGVAGTNGAGKDTLAILRAAEQGAGNESLSDMLRRELDTRGLSHERENLRNVGNELRSKFGPGVLASRAIDEYRASGNTAGLSITSVRSIGEVEAIQAEGGEIVWVDADPKLRYARILARLRASDHKTYEQFLAEEEVEMHPPEDKKDDKGVLNMAAVKESATIFITNEFPDEEAYKAFLRNEYEIRSAN